MRFLPFCSESVIQCIIPENSTISNLLAPRKNKNSAVPKSVICSVSTKLQN